MGTTILFEMNGPNDFSLQDYQLPIHVCFGPRLTWFWGSVALEAVLSRLIFVARPCE